MSNAEQMYHDLLSNGELLDVYPELKRRGQENSWEQDQVKFTRLYNQTSEVPDDLDDLITFEELY